MTIGALAEASGVSVDTIRFYEKRGLLPAPPRTAGGFRDFGPEAVERLASIARAKSLGFTLTETASLLRWRDVPEADAEAVRATAVERLRETEAALVDLERQRQGLARLVSACGGSRTVRSDCPILSEIAG